MDVCVCVHMCDFHCNPTFATIIYMSRQGKSYSKYESMHRYDTYTEAWALCMPEDKSYSWKKNCKWKSSDCLIQFIHTHTLCTMQDKSRKLLHFFAHAFELETQYNFILIEKRNFQIHGKIMGSLERSSFIFFLLLNGKRITKFCRFERKKKFKIFHQSHNMWRFCTVLRHFIFEITSTKLTRLINSGINNNKT